MVQQDEDLVRRWQAGDPSGFEDLVRRWQHPMGRFLARVVGRADLVPDLCQEVFLRIFQVGRGYREQGTFSTWIYRIALNVARDAARRNRRVLQSLREREPAANGASALARCEQEELADAVAAALAELPAPLREVLVLRHYEDINFEAMSRLLQTPASTLKSRFAVALRRLRDRLKHLDWHPEEKS
jgi:RNA polymerase sigma-70 factor (ECF subfamily)